MPIIKRKVRQNEVGQAMGGSTYDVLKALGVILEHMRRGVRFAAACELAGLSKTTGYYWLALGESRVEGEEPLESHIQFAAEIRMVEAELEAEFVLVWTTQAKHDWRAARDFLSKRFGKAWGRYATQAETEFPEPSGKEGRTEVIEMRDYSWQAALHRQMFASMEGQEQAMAITDKVEQEVRALAAGEGEPPLTPALSPTQEGKGEGEGN
jgi:hypothetical protein